MEHCSVALLKLSSTCLLQVSLWNYKVYYVYGFMLLVFLILAIVTACVTVVATYFLLNAENYHWKWTSFFSGASVGIYVGLYSIHFLLFKTKMSGFFQISFYLGYSLLACIAIGLMQGAIGHVAASVFCQHIYRQVKAD